LVSLHGGLRVVMDRCLKVEHARWIGGQREATGD
jgi:predicted CoA-binding protein